MMKLIAACERYARYIATVVAVLAALVWIAFQMQWIRSSAEYRVSSWYLVDARSNYYLSTEYADRRSCFEHLRDGQVCKTGSDMVARELADQASRVAAIR